jgi:hypothetical protein
MCEGIAGACPDRARAAPCSLPLAVCAPRRALARNRFLPSPHSIFSLMQFPQHARGERRRAEVREHHRHSAALGSVLRLRLFQTDLRRCLDRADMPRDGRQHLSPMAEQHTDVVKVLIGEMAKHPHIDLVVGKAFRVLGPCRAFPASPIFPSSPARPWRKLAEQVPSPRNCR